MSWGLMEQLAAAIRTGRVSEKGLNGFRKGGAIVSVAELLEEGTLTDADLVEIISRAKPPAWPLTPDQERARDIIGQSFVSPSAFCVAIRNRVRFTDEEVAALAVIPWSDEVLREELAHGAVLFPTRPSVTLPWLREVYGTDPESQPCFWKDSHWWLGKDGNPFRDRGLPVGWRLVRTILEPDSTSKTWDAQEEFIPETHRRTAALEVGIACPLVFRTQGGKRILEASYAWCEDEDAVGYRVSLGCFVRRGLNVDARPPGVDWRSFGLLLSRK